ncbi:MAG: DUF962 domain-containing protein [Proteobacteria bacterium]|nr:DUF962 domain-containing protein [Pseudomonadota bacterium]
MARIQSLSAFWPHYISEHSSPTSRRLHFVGTSGFLASCAVSTVLNPIGFPLAMAGMVAIATDGVRRVEKDRRSVPHVLGALILPSLASPVVFPAGVVCAYGFAWVGHFKFEGNKPATFQYPLWSLTSDFKMYGHMLRGRLWSGNPVEELGLTAPAAS